MQDKPTGASGAALRGAENISLDQLISATSTSVLRALQEHERLDKRIVNPRIWVGIWIDLDRFRQDLAGGPGPGPG